MRAAWDLLACSVRGCGRPLEQAERAFRCSVGHAFDVARAGYLNLLQPQDRRSLAAGDSQAAVEARLALEARGVGAEVDAALADLLGSRGVAPRASVVDLGAGTGARLARLAERFGLAALGLDLSAFAAGAAARRHPAGAWCVANCDRVLPVRSASTGVVLSVDARRPAGEIARVLAGGGVFLVAVPGAADLAELRAATLLDARPLQGLTRVEAELGSAFELVERAEVVVVRDLDADGLRDLARATYRAGRRAESARLAELASLSVTFAHEIGLFRPRGA